MQQGIDYTAYDLSEVLTIAAKIYDITSGTAVIDSTVAMPHVINGTYAGVFDADDGKTYLVNTMVYTSGSYITPDTNYTPGSKTVPKRATIFKKNTAYAGFLFPMYDSDGVLATGLTVTAAISIDGAAFSGAANSVIEVSSGLYKLDLDAVDLNGNSIALKFAATGARTSIVSIFTQL